MRGCGALPSLRPRIAALYVLFHALNDTLRGQWRGAWLASTDRPTVRPTGGPVGRTCAHQVWDVKYGTLLRTLEGHSAPVRCLLLLDPHSDQGLMDLTSGHTGGDLLVSGSDDMSAKLWAPMNRTGEALRTFQESEDGVQCLEAHRGLLFLGLGVLAGGGGGAVHVWDIRSGQREYDRTIPNTAKRPGRSGEQEYVASHVGAGVALLVHT